MPVTTRNSSFHNFSSKDGFQDFTLDTNLKVIFFFLGFVAFLIIIANGLVFVLAWNMKYLRTRTNFFLFSLAASDLLSGAVVVPLVLSCNIVTVNQSLCIAMDICQRGLAISTILHLSSAVIERYLKISSPFRYTSIVTKPRISCVLISIWILAMSVSLSQLFIISSQDVTKAYLVYNTTVLSLFVFVPFFITVLAFIRIYFIMKQSKKSRMRLTIAVRENTTNSTQRKKRVNTKRSLIVYLAMLLCFVFAWFPYFFLTLLIDLDNSVEMSIPHWMNALFLFLKVSSALFNPLLFTFFKADFQKALNQMTSGKLCKQVANTQDESARKRFGSNSMQTNQTHLQHKTFEIEEPKSLIINHLTR